MWAYIKYYLFRLRLTQLSERDFSELIDHYEVQKIEYALKKGNYRTRRLAAQALEFIGDESSVPYLLKAMNDKVQNVSIAALNALEAINVNDELTLSIIKKRFDWVRELREKKEKFDASKGQKSNIYKWERTTKKNFEMVKERLKRPIR